MKKKYLAVVILAFFSLLFAEGTNQDSGNPVNETGTETNTKTTKEKTEKTKRQEIKDSIDQTLKEVQKENEVNGTGTGGTAAPTTDPGQGHTTTVAPGTDTSHATTPVTPAVPVETVTPKAPKTQAVKIDPKKPVKKAIDKEKEGASEYKGAILKYVATRDGYKLAASGSDVIHPVASLTKVMNILVALDQIDKGNKSLDDKVCFDQATANVGGSWLNVKDGECFALRDLLRAENIYSANNAAYLVAKHIGDGSIDKFVELMNAKAKELGMKNTKFYTPAGLPTSMTGKQLDTSTAEDLYLMALAAMKDNRIREWANEKELVLINSAGEQVVYDSRNKLLGKSGIWGLKTGFHNLSGYNIIVTSKHGNLEVVAVVLGEKSDIGRTKYILEEFKGIEGQMSKIKTVGTEMGEFKLKDGKKKVIKGILSEDIYEIKGNSYEYTVKDLNVKAPVEKGTVIGKLIVQKDGEQISEVNIIADEEVKELSGFGKFLRFISFGLL